MSTDAVFASAERNDFHSDVTRCDDLTCRPSSRLSAMIVCPIQARGELQNDRKYKAVVPAGAEGEAPLHILRHTILLPGYGGVRCYSSRFDKFESISLTMPSIKMDGVGNIKSERNIELRGNHKIEIHRSCAKSSLTLPERALRSRYRCGASPRRPPPGVVAPDDGLTTANCRSSDHG